jgi:hypothetical protein
MTRLLAFLAAVFLTALTFASTCIADSGSPLVFTIEPVRNPDQVQIRFRQQREGRWDNDWNSTFRASELAGLDVSQLNGAVVRPIRFAVTREAGRIDCAGTAADAMAHGTCSLTPDAGFMAYLSTRGIRQPTEEETYGLISLNVHRSLLDALAAERYPTPSIENFMALTAVGVTPSYIRSLADAGYRPTTVDGLIQFSALKITPEFIGSYIRAGYGNLRPDELIQLKAMNITPDFIAGFERIGYRHLPIDTIVQLKALDITPEFVRAVQQGGALPSPEHLVELRALGRDLHHQ